MTATYPQLYNEEDISADTGEVSTVFVANFPAIDPGEQEIALNLRLRIKTHTPQDPYVDGQMLVTVRWHDGVIERSWDVACNTSPGNYNEQGQDIWLDRSRDLTIQVQPLVAGGSVDVRLIVQPGV